MDEEMEAISIELFGYSNPNVFDENEEIEKQYRKGEISSLERRL